MPAVPLVAAQVVYWCLAAVCAVSCALLVAFHRHHMLRDAAREAGGGSDAGAAKDKVSDEEGSYERASGDGGDGDEAAGAARRRAHWVKHVALKGTCALCFVAAGAVCLASNPSDAVPAPQILIMAALVLSFLGDIFLTFLFVPGLASFALAHVCFIAAFASMPGLLWLPAVVVGALLLLLAAALVVFAFPAGAKPPMKAAVTAYMVIIAGMVALASATAVVDLVVAAVLFLASDLGIIRGAVYPGWHNKLSLALYFAGQLIFAHSLSGRVLIYGRL
jgi:uncharacterized membrane protein YhhN